MEITLTKAQREIIERVEICLHKRLLTEEMAKEITLCIQERQSKALIRRFFLATGALLSAIGTIGASIMYLWHNLQGWGK